MGEVFESDSKFPVNSKILIDDTRSVVVIKNIFGPKFYSYNNSGLNEAVINTFGRTNEKPRYGFAGLPLNYAAWKVETDYFKPVLE